MFRLTDSPAGRIFFEENLQYFPGKQKKHGKMNFVFSAGPRLIKMFSPRAESRARLHVRALQINKNYIYDTMCSPYFYQVLPFPTERKNIPATLISSGADRLLQFFTGDRARIPVSPGGEETEAIPARARARQRYIPLSKFRESWTRTAE